MALLTYSAICSLDGYVADTDGRWEWAFPDEEVHAFVNDQERGVGTMLLGRRMYDVLKVWDTMGDDDNEIVRDFAAIWLGIDKVVYSRTLDEVPTARTTLERTFEPEAIRARKAAADRDLSIGGGELAGQALAAGLVDELRLIQYPVIVGGGTPALPDGLRVDLELAEEGRFACGAVHLRYVVRG
jgi:dihydrofolate reductase